MARDIRFVRDKPYACPQYGPFYIQDRMIGKDVYGHDSYEYALFRRIGFQLVRKFRTRRQAYEYLSKITSITQWDIKMGAYDIVVNDSKVLGIKHGKTLYKLIKYTREVYARPLEDEKLSQWYTTYNECLEKAKKIVREIERQEEQWEQMKFL